MALPRSLALSVRFFALTNKSTDNDLKDWGRTMKRMSKEIYAGIFSVSLGLFLFLGLLMGITVLLQNLVWFQQAPGVGVQIIVVLGVLGFAQFLIVQMIYTFVILWKMWSSIQDGQARTTPGKAIGFLHPAL